MKLNAQIAGSSHTVDVRLDATRVLAEVDDRSYQLEVRETSGGYLFIHDGQVFNCHVDGRPESGQAMNVSVGAEQFAVTVIDRKRLLRASEAGAHGAEAAQIVAPMPGKVVRLLVEAGHQIETGAGVVVVEAMKMQNEMRSPKSGTVASVNVQVGDTVNAGDVLAVIE
jgi:biotin carboxyl carrier protein